MFAGPHNIPDPRSEAENWNDIISLKVESSYVVGLTKEGKVKMAGTYTPLLDMERSTASDWENVMAISTGISNIAAIFNDGTLKIVGVFSGDKEKIYKDWNEKVRYIFEGKKKIKD